MSKARTSAISTVPFISAFLLFRGDYTLLSTLVQCEVESTEIAFWQEVYGRGGG